MATKIEYRGDEAKFDRAIDLTATASEWRPLRRADGKCWGVAMPSQTQLNTYYIVTPRTCTCADYERRQKVAGGICKHSLALNIETEMRRAARSRERAA